MLHRLLRACCDRVEQLRQPFKVRWQVAPNREAITHETDAHTREGASRWTYVWEAYAALKLCGEHVMIREEKGRLVGETVSTGLNTLELLKNWLYPYRGIPRQCFHP